MITADYHIILLHFSFCCLHYTVNVLHQTIDSSNKILGYKISCASITISNRKIHNLKQEDNYFKTKY